MNEPTAWRLVIVFFAAMIVRLATNLISPVHEVMHGLLAVVQGQPLGKMGWNYIFIYEMNNATLVGAYFMELALYTFIVIRAKPRTFGVWCLGVVHALILRAPFSEDFLVSESAPGVFFVLWFIAIGICWYTYLPKRWDRVEKETAAQERAA